MITYKNIKGHYEIYVNGIFYCSCDINELKETLAEVQNELKDA